MRPAQHSHYSLACLGTPAPVADQLFDRAGDAVPGEWRVRQMLCLALCQVEAGRGDDAARTLARAQELANRAAPRSRVRWLAPIS